MKNAIKLFVTGLVIFLASSSFGQSKKIIVGDVPTLSASKGGTTLPQNADVQSLNGPILSATATKGETNAGKDHLAEIKSDYPNVYNHLVKEKQNLKTDGMSQKQVNMMLEKKIHEFRMNSFRANHPGFANFAKRNPAAVHKMFARRVVK